MTLHLRNTSLLAALLLSAFSLQAFGASPSTALREDALAALKKASTYYHGKVATNGGYAYYYTPDLKERWGEGVGTETQVWVEPPGTPAVGLAYLAAHEATNDPFYLAAARDTALALVYGQLESGGWRQTIDFDPKGDRVAQYRNGKGGTHTPNPNHSSLDDNQTQSAILCLVRVDKALDFKDPAIHEAALYALDNLLKAQFPIGAFPQGWKEPSKPHPALKASYPKKWPRTWPDDSYWKNYTLNDGLCDTVTDTLIAAWEIYRDPRYRDAATRVGDFLLLAQMPDPQPAWAQQYDFKMQPIWARRFEPPAISCLESEGAIATLLKIHALTGDPRYLAPIQPALDYLKKHLLPDGRLPRYIELQTDRPLYMNRTNPKNYYLTYDDTNLPSHYGWKQPTKIARLQARLNAALQNRALPERTVRLAERERQVAAIIKTLDAEGRWIDTYSGQRLTGQPRFKRGFRYLSSRTFIDNVEALSAYLKAATPE